MEEDQKKDFDNYTEENFNRTSSAIENEVNNLNFMPDQQEE